jgi:hypothetical protein
MDFLSVPKYRISEHRFFAPVRRDEMDQAEHAALLYDVWSDVKHYAWEYRYVFYYITSLMLFVAPFWFLVWFKEVHGKRYLAYQLEGSEEQKEADRKEAAEKKEATGKKGTTGKKEATDKKQEPKKKR